jgi:hypothetical protein
MPLTGEIAVYIILQSLAILNRAGRCFVRVGQYRIEGSAGSQRSSMAICLRSLSDATSACFLRSLFKDYESMLYKSTEREYYTLYIAVFSNSDNNSSVSPFPRIGMMHECCAVTPLMPSCPQPIRGQGSLHECVRVSPFQRFNADLMRASEGCPREHSGINASPGDKK